MKGVISIGANLGQEYEGWLSLGVSDFIFFEPVKDTFDKLKKIMNGKPENIRLYRMALGNMNGKIKMYIETSHQGKSCSIYKPKLHLEQYPDIEFNGKEWVNITKLDLVDFDRTLYDHLHIDVQGYEMEVLKGAVHSLDFIDTIEIEVHRAELYEGCVMYTDVINYLADKGFEVTDLFWRGNTWGDCKLKRI